MSKVCCDYCKGPTEYVSSAQVYGGRDYGMIYLCRPCWAYVGVHKGTDRPLGRLANAELREWKKKAHAAFDPLWFNFHDKRKARVEAYALLAEAMRLDRDDCHIGMFDVENCKLAIEAVQAILAMKNINERMQRRDTGRA